MTVTAIDYTAWADLRQWLTTALPLVPVDERESGVSVLALGISEDWFEDWLGPGPLAHNDEVKVAFRAGASGLELRIDAWLRRDGAVGRLATLWPTIDFKRVSRSSTPYVTLSATASFALDDVAAAADLASETMRYGLLVTHPDELSWLGPIQGMHRPSGPWAEIAARFAVAATDPPVRRVAGLDLVEANRSAWSWNEKHGVVLAMSRYGDWSWWIDLARSRHAAGDSEAARSIGAVASEMHLAGRFGRFTPDASVLAELDSIR